MIGKLEVELMAESEDAIVNGLPYIHAFRAFEQVVSRCFAVTLKEEYAAAIDVFKTAYLELGITVTPKVNTIVNHTEA